MAFNGAAQTTVVKGVDLDSTDASGIAAALAAGARARRPIRRMLRAETTCDCGAGLGWSAGIPDAIAWIGIVCSTTATAVIRTEGGLRPGEGCVVRQPTGTLPPLSPAGDAAVGDAHGSGLFRRCAWAVEGAQQVLLFVGIGNDQEHEGIDRHNTSLPGLQVLRVPLSTLSTLAVHSASATPQRTSCRVVPIPPEQRNAVGSSESRCDART